VADRLANVDLRVKVHSLSKKQLPILLCSIQGVIWSDHSPERITMANHLMVSHCNPLWTVLCGDFLLWCRIYLQVTHMVHIVFMYLVGVV